MRPLYHYRFAIGQDKWEILAVWERSVIATHEFLGENIEAIKNELAGCLSQSEIVVVCHQEGQIKGFASVAEGHLNMLFLDPSVIGTGVGSRLFDHMYQNYPFRTLDVNKDNPKSLEFYQRKGFRIIAESANDDQGRPFPILHLKK